jgi:hypothetical protein
MGDQASFDMGRMGKIARFKKLALLLFKTAKLF